MAGLQRALEVTVDSVRRVVGIPLSRRSALGRAEFANSRIGSIGRQRLGTRRTAPPATYVRDTVDTVDAFHP